LFDNIPLKGLVSQQGQFDASVAPDNTEKFENPLIDENRAQEKIWEFGGADVKRHV